MYHPVSRQGMIEVDRIMVDDLGIKVVLMMEHAGLNLAKICVSKAEQLNLDSFIVVAGSGNNGGGGMVCARKLVGWGKKVILWLPKGEPTREVPKIQLDRAKACGVDVVYELPEMEESLVVDAYIGYNFHGELNTEAKVVIDAMKLGNIVSLDIPSGVDSNNGRNEGGLHPVATVTLAWPKEGLFKLDERNLGELFLVDIGVPGWVYREESVLVSSAQPSNNNLNRLGDEFTLRSVFEIKLNRENGLWDFQ